MTGIKVGRVKGPSPERVERYLANRALAKPKGIETLRATWRHWQDNGFNNGVLRNQPAGLREELTSMRFALTGIAGRPDKTPRFLNFRRASSPTPSIRSTIPAAGLK